MYKKCTASASRKYNNLLFSHSVDTNFYFSKVMKYYILAGDAKNKKKLKKCYEIFVNGKLDKK